MPAACCAGALPLFDLANNFKRLEIIITISRWIKLWKNGYKNEFIADVLKLASGTALAQLLTILAAPFIARLYGPEEFGLSAIFASIAGIIVVVVCLRYEPAIMLPKDDEEAANVLGLCFIIAIIISSLTLPIIFVGRAFFLRLLNAQELYSYIWLLFPVVLFSGMFAILNYWISRSKQFGHLAIARISSSFATTGIQLSAGLTGNATAISLIVAGIAGLTVSNIFLFYHIYNNNLVYLKRTIKWQKMIVVLRRYKNFPRYDAGSILLNTISWQIPILLLSFFFSPVITGFYSLSFAIIQVPMALIAGSISQVFFQRAAEAKRNGTLATAVENIFEILITLSLVPLLLLSLSGKDIFIVIFGLEWSEAGIYSQILSIWAIVLFVSSPLSVVISILEKQEINLKLNIANLTMRFFSIAIAGYLENPRLAIILFSASGFILYGCATILITDLAGVPRERINKLIVKNLIIFMPLGCIILAVNLAGFGSLIKVFIATILLFIYISYIFISYNKKLLDFKTGPTEVKCR